MIVNAAFAASAASCAPLVVDYIADILSNAPKDSFSNFIPRREIFLILIVPDMIILIYMLPYELYDALNGLICARDAIFNLAMLSYLNALGPHLFTKKVIYSVAFLIMISNGLIAFSVVTNNPRNWNIMTTAIICSMTIAFAILSITLTKWYNYVRQLKVHEIEIHHRFCNVYAGVYMCFLLGAWLPFMIPDMTRDPSWGLYGVNYGVNYLSLYSLLLASCTVIISVMTTRLARYESNETKVIHIILLIIRIFFYFYILTTSISSLLTLLSFILYFRKRLCGIYLMKSELLSILSFLDCASWKKTY